MSLKNRLETTRRSATKRIWPPNGDLVKHLTSEPSAQFEPGNKGDLMFLAIIHRIVPFTIGDAEPVL
jgi:hypothetical protein